MSRLAHLSRHLPLLVLLALLLPGLAAQARDDFLLPDQAFQPSAEAIDADTLKVRWRIAEGYYLYAAKFAFTTDTAGITLGEPVLPEPEIKQDEFFGEVGIYRDTVEITLPVTRSAAAPEVLTLETTSQGCADAGLCYPPHRQRVQIRLPAPPLAPPAPAIPLPGLDAGAGISRALGLDDEEILTVDQAFDLQVEVLGPERVRLHWEIAPGTYLYRDLVEVALDDAQLALEQPALPPGEIKHDSVLPDGSIGDVAVYHDRLTLDLSLRRATTEALDTTLVVGYQGCAERGICYPPQHRRLTLALPAGGSAAPIAAAPAPAAPAPSAAPISEQDRLASTLANASLWTSVALFFGLGLLLAFTPCVFPMIPILSGIIAGQGAGITTRRAFVLSLVYVLAMALTYTVAGVLAGLFGANLQAAFQDPWILGAFALVFVALALSMFGFYDLQLPASLQSRLAALSNRQQGGTLAGVAIMGLLSALIVGPCVAPPLFGALIYISQTGDALLGGVALFALSLGMGAPLIVIGTSAGKLLPRAGAWMEAVKAVFGVALLAVAISLIERVIPAAVAMLLWGLLLICSAVYLGALSPLGHESGGWRKLWKGLGVALLVYGGLMLIGAAAGGKDTLQPLRGLGIGGGEAAHAEFTRVKTVADLDRELAAASAQGRPVMLDFYADWCVACKEMERYTFSDPAVIAELDRFVLLQADVTANDAADQALMQGRFGIPGPPAMLFFGADGAERTGFRLVGFTPAEAFADHLRRAAP
ncbi:protein-disulfide reductase DsbD [Marichromatium gracile]|uniref:Thiol:disulfide interchange protein DsbD n=1 Tax=Marichromatium gracile TaxID=1048 RepID=A0A4R4AJS6_MARGR|nr:protein-disulfide reductase DsbD [Marichromatium gracile]MBK1709893.1 thiol:disulfide interchange protein [Marichromatium gracile]TCW39647.1 thiol:disulfide interchange protein DsbD [Marichromatium gracile]